MGEGGGGLMPTISAKTSAFPRSADIFLEPDYFLGAGINLINQIRIFSLKKKVITEQIVLCSNVLSFLLL